MLAQIAADEECHAGVSWKLQLGVLSVLLVGDGSNMIAAQRSEPHELREAIEEEAGVEVGLVAGVSTTRMRQ